MTKHQSGLPRGKWSKVPRSRIKALTANARDTMTTVHPLILSGGSGTRLWPLSRKAHPKQFLSVLGKNSLFQDTCLRLSDTVFERPTVIANEAHRFLVAEQMRELDLVPAGIVLEPMGRNTAPAAIIGALMAAREDDSRLLLMLPSDHAITDREGFIATVKAGIKAAEAGSIVTFGIKPTHPHTGYGYIEAADGDGGVLDVSRFVEKPSEAKAREYVESGRFFWNAGIFLFTAHALLEAADRCCPQIVSACRNALLNAKSDLDFTRLSETHFAEAESISLDYAIIERSDNIKCVPMQAAWSDLGSWTEIWQASPKAVDGNVARGDARFLKAKNSFAYSDGGAAVSVVGLEDVVVVATRDAVLVTSKAEAQSVKDVVASYEKEGRDLTINHNRVHRPWGWYERLAIGDRYQVKCIMVKPGAQLSLQAHFHRSEHWIVVSGTCEVTIGDTKRIVAENQSTYVPLNAIHRLANPGKIPALMIEVQSGSYLGEDDIIRFEDVYGRAGT